MHPYIMVGGYSVEEFTNNINANSRKGYEVCFYSTCLDAEGKIYFSVIMRRNV